MSARALLDTSVIVDLAVIDADRLPEESSIATITLAELSAGLHVVTDCAQRAAGQKPRGGRVVELFIAPAALSRALPFIYAEFHEFW